VLCCSGGLLAAPDARLRRRSQIAAGMLRKSTTLFLLGRPDGAATCGPRGSPFQLPTRLADGLGLRSGLGSGSPLPFAPVRNSTPDLGPPHRPAGRQANLGCNYFERFSQSHKFFNCQMRLNNPPARQCDPLDSHADRQNHKRQSQQEKPALQREDRVVVQPARCQGFALKQQLAAKENSPGKSSLGLSNDA